MHGHVKRRSWPEPGSIPDVLDMFRCEVRFYREIAPVAGVRVPACYQVEETAEGTLLVLEDLSAWQPGADLRWPLACWLACIGGGRARLTGAGHGFGLQGPPLTWWSSCSAGPGRSWQPVKI